MKYVPYAVVLTLLALVAWSLSSSRPSLYVGSWKVDWAKSAPAIREVPQTFRSRVKTVEEFRNLVGQRASTLVVDVHPDHTATFHHPKEKLKLTWSRSSWRHDIWLQQKFFYMSASIGHGLKVTGARSATLTYQVEWSENVATRVPLQLVRQGPAPAWLHLFFMWPAIALLSGGSLAWVALIRWRRRRREQGPAPAETS